MGPDPGAPKVYDSVVCETPLKVAGANLAKVSTMKAPPRKRRGGSGWNNM